MQNAKFDWLVGTDQVKHSCCVTTKTTFMIWHTIVWDDRGRSLQVHHISKKLDGKIRPEKQPFADISTICAIMREVFESGPIERRAVWVTGTLTLAL